MAIHRSLTLGIDAGGTFTDLVLVAEQAVVAKAKAPTTHGKPAYGIANAIDRLPRDHLKDVRLVSLSTTFATNAMVEGKGGRVAAVLAGYTTRDMNQASLRDTLTAVPHVFVAGGHDSLGNRLADLDERSCVDFVKRHQGQVDAFAVSSYFAPRNPEHENRLRDICRDVGGLPVSCGHELSAGLNAPRRAVTCIVNARLVPLIDQLISDVETVLRDKKLDAPLMVVTGSGTMLPSRLARLRPVETILSGPASGVVGACSLTGVDRAVVADMGGTTTDVALVEKGRALGDPRGAVVGNIQTMVSAVRVRTIGLGGDSDITVDDGVERIGPRRVIPLCRLSTVERNPGDPAAIREAAGSTATGGQAPLADGLAPRATNGSAATDCLPATERHIVALPGGAQKGDTGDNGTGPQARPSPGIDGRTTESADSIAVREGARQGAEVARAGAALDLPDRLVQHAAVGPLPWSRAVELAGSTFAAERAVEKLVKSGRCLVSGFTPTDALVALGRAALGDRDAALNGARRHANRTAGLDDAHVAAGRRTEQSVCEAVASRVSVLAARAVLAAVLDHDAGHLNLGATPEDLAAASVPDDVLDTPRDHRRFADLSPRLTAPIVGIGAPAAAFLAQSATILNTTLITPDNAEVAGAVGAAVARLYREASAVINYLGRERGYRLHGPETVEDFETAPAAVDRGRTLTRETARRLAIEADADPESVEVFVDVTETNVMIDGQVETLTVNIRAEATGNAKYLHL